MSAAESSAVAFFEAMTERARTGRVLSVSSGVRGLVRGHVMRGPPPKAECDRLMYVHASAAEIAHIKATTELPAWQVATELGMSMGMVYRIRNAGRPVPYPDGPMKGRPAKRGYRYWGGRDGAKAKGRVA